LVTPTEEEMTEVVRGLKSCKLPSYKRTKVYTVVDVVEREHVILKSPTRKSHSVLRWKDIKRAYEWPGLTADLPPTVVDGILRDSKNLESSTMCALVLAMRDPSRVVRS
jgi:hypothetical protein